MTEREKQTGFVAFFDNFLLVHFWITVRPVSSWIQLILCDKTNSLFAKGVQHHLTIRDFQVCLMTFWSCWSWPLWYVKYNIMLKIRKNGEKGLNNEFMNFLQKLLGKKLFLEPWYRVFSMNAPPLSFKNLEEL